MLADVLFPQKIKPLTYIIPQDISNRDITGYIVSAPLKKQESFGIVIKSYEQNSDTKKYKHINNIHSKYADKTLISLILWASEYYLSSAGTALMSTQFKDYISNLFKSKNKEHKPCNLEKDSNEVVCPNLHIGSDVVEKINVEISKRNYKTFFVRLESIHSEMSFISEIIIKLDLKRVLILVPESSYISAFKNLLYRIFGNRFVIITSKMKSKDKGRAINNILTGHSDIILGTRSAVYAPLSDISMIIVVSEHSPSYKAEEGLRYNARDVAVMRGFLSNCPVLLTSYAPSIETYFNVKSGRYNEIRVLSNTKPSCNVILLNTDFKKKLKNTIPLEILKYCQDILNSNGTFAIFAQSEGYSFIFCKDCARIMKCPECPAPMVFNNDKKKFSCNRCNHNASIPNTCNYCGGIDIAYLGIGLDRVRHEIKKIADKLKCYEFNTDSLKSILINKGIKTTMDNIDGAAVLDFDHLLLKYGFRSNERIFQDMMRLKSMIKDKGTLFIETSGHNPDLIKALKNDDISSFYNYELKQRVTASYPPFFKIILINIYAKESVLTELILEIQNIKTVGEVQLFVGDVLKSDKKGFDYHVKIILRGKEKRLLNDIAIFILRLCNKQKRVVVSLDVDPYMI